MKISDNHISMLIGNDVKEIAKPFFDISGISYFHYGAFYKSGHCVALCSNTEWHKFWVEADLYLLNANYPTNSYNLCEITSPIIAENAKKYFKIDHFFEITKEYEDHYVLAGFDTNCGNDRIVDYYLNNRDLLERFTLYFKEQAHKLIALSEKKGNRIILPEFRDKNFELRPAGVHEIDFISQKNTNQQADFNNHIRLFSKRELDCIRYLLLGNSMRETGDKLLISPRTVETYIENVKNKLGCNKKSELIAELLKNGFTHNLPT